MEFKNKTVIISGATGGLGKALCFQLGLAGAHIIGLDLHETLLNSLQDALVKKGISTLCKVCDVTQPEACRTVIKEAIQIFDTIDIVINNAGVTHLATAVDTPSEKVHQVMAINYMGAVNCTLPALDSVIQNRGMVVAISSVAGFVPLYGRSAYAASKHALHGYFGTLRCELKSKNVKVMLVSPSFIDTPIRARAGQDYAQSNLKSAIPPSPKAEKYTTGLHYSPEQVAGEIISAMEKEKRFLITGATGKKSYWIHKFFPKFFERLMVKKMAPAIDL